MKHFQWRVLPVIISMLLPAPLFSFTKDEALNAIRNAEIAEKRIRSDAALAPYVPFDLYGDAMVGLNGAGSMLGERNYPEAYYQASMSMVRFEAAYLTAQARKARFEKAGMSKRAAPRAPETGLADAGMVKKGDVYRTSLYDWQLFITKKNRIIYRLNQSAGEHLDLIAGLLQRYPEARLKIVGHMEEPDYRDYSRQKADIVARYLIGKNVPPERLDVIGLGNREVMETHLGYRRVARVEFILSGVR